MASFQTITGKDGMIAMLLTAPAALTAQAMSQITGLPGGTLTYPAKQIFSVTTRANKVWDPRSPLNVYNSAVLVKKTDYKVLWGSGTILFRQPLSGTPVITTDFSYYPTATGNDVVPAEHVNNWQLALNATQSPADEYGTDIIPNNRGKFAGTWQFDRHAGNYDLWNRMMLESYFVFALYSSLQENRLWIIYGDLSSHPENAPGDATASGTITGVMKAVPTFLAEAL